MKTQALSRERPYRPFPNLAHRNAIQERFEVPTLARLLHLPPGRRILEVGCGRGVALAPLARVCRPSRLVGLELDGGLLGEAAKATAVEGVGVELVQGDVRSLPFPSASFDIVVDFGTCYHIDRPAEALGEIERVLADDGLFVHETPLGQLFAHPVRSLGRSLPWAAAPGLRRNATAVFWATRSKR